MSAPSIIKIIQIRQIQTSVCCTVGEKWRLRNGLPRSGNEYGPLTDIPDWSYADGRPSPMQNRQQSRNQQLQDFTKQTMAMMKEMKDSRKVHQERQQQVEETRKQILQQKIRLKTHKQNS